MTNEERDLFVKARDLLSKSKFHYNAQKAERDVVVEEIQELLCRYGLDLLAKQYEDV